MGKSSLKERLVMVFNATCKWKRPDRPREQSWGYTAKRILKWENVRYKGKKNKCDNGV